MFLRKDAPEMNGEKATVPLLQHRIISNGGKTNNYIMKYHTRPTWNGF